MGTIVREVKKDDDLETEQTGETGSEGRTSPKASRRLVAKMKRLRRFGRRPAA